MILRTYALYAANTLVLIFLAFLLIAEGVLMAAAVTLIGSRFSLILQGHARAYQMMY